MLRSPGLIKMTATVKFTEQSKKASQKCYSTASDLPGFQPFSDCCCLSIYHPIIWKNTKTNQRSRSGGDKQPSSDRSFAFLLTLQCKAMAKAWHLATRTSSCAYAIALILQQHQVKAPRRQFLHRT